MLKLSGIVEDSIVDGPGIRVTIFCQGCPHHCPGCHNPETWDFSGGTAMEEERLVQIVRSNPLCRGVTFSGGEPFAQPEPLAELAAGLKVRGFHLMSYSGYTFEELLALPGARLLLEQLDLLVDGPFVEARKDIGLRFRGSANQRVLDVPASLAAGAPLWCGQYR